MFHPVGPPMWAPIYVGSQIVLSGSMITIQGMDVCGLVPAGFPPISLAPSAVLVGTAGLSGNPANPLGSPIALDLNEQIEALKKGARPVLNRFSERNAGGSCCSCGPLC